ncbi:DUF6670 family protein [Patulibacter defluvii]|uniref:DUF6670 family protein n=1 Tax=Patulibacter defluvii TaxID=3095358 RepID=UPI002A751428|nr:DUF6670 family protein [Patulibacter sp. DM4]
MRPPSPAALAAPILRAASAPVARLVGAHAPHEGRLPAAPRFRPHARSARYAWTHYGLMIPDLPAPHRFFSFMSLVGATGSLIFDTDAARVDRPRRTATLVNATAATAPGHFRAYSIPRECAFADDGSLVRFGDDAELTGLHPSFRLRGLRDDFPYDLRISCGEQVTFFVRGPLWQHFGILSRYEGTIGDEAVAGHCSFEYGACALSPHMVTGLPLPRALKLPGDRFVYNILALGPGRQLLLSNVGLAGQPLVEAAYLRDVDGTTRRTVRGVRATVTAAASATTTPDGREARLPERLRWRGPGIEIEAVIDTPMVFGLGSGHVGGCAFRGTLDGDPIAGRGYLEHIDRSAG